MSDPKDELSARFENRRADTSNDTDDTDNTDDTNDADIVDDTDNPTHTDDTSETTVTDDAGYTGNASTTTDTHLSNDTHDTHSTHTIDDTDTTSDTSNIDSTASNSGSKTENTPTRHRQQVPMYLPDSKVTALNQLYEKLDGRSKIAGDGGIEKHADFMEALVAHAIEHEDELAERVGIPDD